MKCSSSANNYVTCQDLRGIATGLELRLACFGDKYPALGLTDLLGVSGGVTPFPLALDSPIALTKSFTDTPLNSEPSL